MTDDEFLPKKTFGQHWLNDNAVLETMCDYAEIKTGDKVLEIGPGTGNLTAKLLDFGASVIALEYDKDLIEPLKERFKNIDSDRLRIIEGDIRNYNFSDISKTNYKIVANIPYYLTANLMRLLTDDVAKKPLTTVLLVQKEVAERVAATPGSMSVISVAAQLYYSVGLGPIVEAKLFTPPPKVDSQILVLDSYQKPIYPKIDYDLFFRVVKAGFSQRRKTLLNTLSSGLRISREEIIYILDSVHIDPQTRAQSLTLEAWHELYEVIALKLAK